MNRSFLIIANWKMYLSYAQAQQWCIEHRAELAALAERLAITICPDYTALSSCRQLLQATSVQWGAQSCSDEMSGAYTGQVGVQSLSDLGCSYCLVAHHEQRLYGNDTSNDVISKKIRLLADKGIVPIFCCGENVHEKADGKVYDVLAYQLEAVWPVMNALTRQKMKLILAYEPVWAIGTGVPAEPSVIAPIFAWLQEQFRLRQCTVSLIYGGSVTSAIMSQLFGIPGLDGFLIGKASTNFQEFKKVVHLVESAMDGEKI